MSSCQHYLTRCQITHLRTLASFCFLSPHWQLLKVELHRFYTSQCVYMSSEELQAMLKKVLLGQVWLQRELCESDKLLQVMSLNLKNDPSLYIKTVCTQLQLLNPQASTISCDHVPRSHLLTVWVHWVNWKKWWTKLWKIKPKFVINRNYPLEMSIKTMFVDLVLWISTRTLILKGSEKQNLWCETSTVTWTKDWRGGRSEDM